MSEQQADWGTEKASMPSAPGAAERLKDATSYLHDRIDLLGHRLEPVMGADFPEGVMEDAMSPAQLDRMIHEVQRAAGRLDNIIARLVL